MPLQGGLSIERMCQLAPVSRAGFYRWLQMPAPVEEEMEVRALIQQIVIEHRRRYGLSAYFSGAATASDGGESQASGADYAGG